LSDAELSADFTKRGGEGASAFTLPFFRPRDNFPVVFAREYSSRGKEKREREREKTGREERLSGEFGTLAEI